MIITVLASGSKGNVTYIETENYKILIDFGRSYKYIKEKLEEINKDISDINYLLLTHTHIDHIAGLKQFIKKHNIIVVLGEKMLEELELLDIKLTNIHLIEDEMELNNLYIKALELSHDCAQCFGYIFKNSTNSLVHITDTGYINRKYFKLLENHDIYIMEFNHDLSMLMNGSYPYYLKQRILGDNGHLSNEQAVDYLKKFVGKNTRKVICIHLSERHNNQELVKQKTAKLSESIDIIISNQDIATEIIKI